MSTLTRRKLTKGFVENLTPKDKPYKIWDTELKGFHVEVTPSGKIVYYLFYRTISHRQRRPALGEHSPAFTTEDARSTARDWLHQVKGGGDPFADRCKLRGDMTFNEFADIYLRDYASQKRPRTEVGIRANINNHLRPCLGHLKVIEITKDDIRATIDAIIEGRTAKTRKTRKQGKSVVTGGRGAARSTYTQLHHMMTTYAVEKGLTTQPHLFALTKKPETKYSKKGRDRFLTEKEYARLGEFLEKCKSRPGIAEPSRLELYNEVWETPRLQLCKKYGISDVGLGKICRRHNIPMPHPGYWRKKETGKPVETRPLPDMESAATQRIEIKNPALTEYHINPSILMALELYLYTGCRKTEILALKIEDVDFEESYATLRTTKTDENVRMPLAKPALDAIRTFLDDRQKNPHRYTYTDANNPYVIPGCKEGQHFQELTPAWDYIRKRLGLEDVTIHDIRRSFGSVGARQNMSLLMIGKALAHKSTEATKVYARLSDDATQSAVSMISNKVYELVKGIQPEPEKKETDMSDLVAASVLKVLQTLQDKGTANDQLRALLEHNG